MAMIWPLAFFTFRNFRRKYLRVYATKLQAMNMTDVRNGRWWESEQPFRGCAAAGEEVARSGWRKATRQPCTRAHGCWGGAWSRTRI